MAHVNGYYNVMRNIGIAINNVKGATLRGQIAALKHLEMQMDTISPTVPEDTRFMRKSWFIEPVKKADGSFEVFAGYTANYAPYVHERTGFINWTKPGSGAKWLQIHFERNKLEMQLIMAKYVKRSLL